MSRFVAIDFETANYKGYSACAIAMVTVEDRRITDRYYSLIQPPGNTFIRRFSELHGIYPSDTEDAPTFYDIYNEIMKRLEDEKVVAHNEVFDRTVLKHCLEYYDLSQGALKLNRAWECTVKLSRKLGFKKNTLDACCERFDIPLNHHNALSDAEACAILYTQLTDIRDNKGK